MFSPSLVSMIFHSLLPDTRRDGVVDPEEGRDYTTSSNVSRSLLRLTADFARNKWPPLPVIGRVTIKVDFERWFQEYVTVDTVDTPGAATFFWGRVPALLVDHFVEYHEIKPEEHYVDLGTTIRALGSGSKYDKACANYLAKTAQSPQHATVGAAIIDLGNGKDLDKKFPNPPITTIIVSATRSLAISNCPTMPRRSCRCYWND
jgi:hypothetical protein